MVDSTAQTPFGGRFARNLRNRAAPRKRVAEADAPPPKASPVGQPGEADAGLPVAEEAAPFADVRTPTGQGQVVPVGEDDAPLALWAGVPVRQENCAGEMAMKMVNALEKVAAALSEAPMAACTMPLPDHLPAVVGVTSAVAGEGKTTVALHLASRLARGTYKRVCLIDLSLSENDLAAQLGLPRDQPGIFDLVEGRAGRALKLDAWDGLVVFPSGQPPVNAEKAVRSPVLASLLGAARDTFDAVVVDLPPVASGLAQPIIECLDGVLMVVAAGITPRDVVASSVEAIGREKAAGVVLNRLKSDAPQKIRRRFLGI